MISEFYFPDPASIGAFIYLSMAFDSNMREEFRRISEVVGVIPYQITYYA